MTNEELAVKLQETEDRSKSNTHRIDKLEKQNEALTKIATSVELVANSQKDMKEDIATIRTDVDDLKAAPSKKWDKVTDHIILTIIGFVIGYFLSGFGG